MRHKSWEEFVEKDGETGGVAQKKLRTERNIELSNEIIFNQEYQSGAYPTLVDIAREPNIDHQ